MAAGDQPRKRPQYLASKTVTDVTADLSLLAYLSMEVVATVLPPLPSSEPPGMVRKSV